MDRKRDFGSELQTARAFLSRHSDHPGVRYALGWLTQWLEDAAVGKDVPEAGHFRRLSLHGVSAFEVLSEAVALFLLSRWRPRSLPDDERLTFAIGTHVLKLAKQERRFGGMRGGRPRTYSASFGKVARRTVGRRIRTHLAPLLSGIALAMEHEHQAKQRTQQALAAPFNVKPLGDL